MQLLMEGLGGAYPLDASNLRKSPDGGKNLSPLTESDIQLIKQTLNESNEGPNKALLEAQGSDGYLYIEGVFSQCDRKNGNGRIYPKSLWAGLVENKDILSKFKSGGGLGMLEHPKDGRSDLAGISHIVVPLAENQLCRIESDGRVIGRAKILNTTAGKNLQELFLGGARVGVSSRGKGSTYRKGPDEIVANDYQLDTWDAVSMPSVDIALPTLVSQPQAAATTTESIKAASNPIRTLKEETKKMSGLNAFKQSEARLKEISEALESSDALKLSNFRDELLEMQMGARSLVESDPSLRDLADDLVASTKELRGKVTAQLETLTDKSLSESIKKITEGKEVNENLSPDVKDVLAKTHERMEFYRNKAQELVESENNVTKKEYEAACQLAEALLKKCKEFQGENKSLKDSLSLKDQELSEITESLSEGSIVSIEEHDELKARYEKSLEIIEHLAQRIRSAQVADRVEECVRQEPALARVRDVLLESKSVEEVNAKVEQMHKLLEGQMVYVPAAKKPAVKDLVETVAEVESRKPVTPKPAPVAAQSPAMAHRRGLIEAIVGKRNTSFPK